MLKGKSLGGQKTTKQSLSALRGRELKGVLKGISIVLILCICIGMVGAYVSNPTIDSSGWHFGNITIGGDSIVSDNRSANIELPTGRATTITVAAYDSSDTSKAQADYACDGTDDQIEINNALSIGSTLLMEGNYSAYNIQVPDYTTLQGSGFNTKITLPNGATGPIITNSDHSSGNIGIIIKDLFVDGNDAGATTYSQGVQINNSQYCEIINVWAQNCKEGPVRNQRGVGIMICNGTTDAVVRGCFATDNGHEGIAVRAPSERISIIGCVAWSNDIEGIQVATEGVNNTECSDIIISGNLVYNHTSYGGITVHGRTLNPHRRISVTNNIVRTAGSGILFYMSGDSGIDGQHVISNNIISDIRTHNDGITVDGCDNVIVSDNIIEDVDLHGINLEQSKFSIVSNNIIKDANFDGIYLRESNFNTISDNTINSSGDCGIDLEESAYCSVTGNMVYNSIDHGIRVGSSSNNCELSDNLFYSNNGGITIMVSKYANIIGNYVTQNDKNGILLSNSNHSNIIGNYIIDNNQENDTEFHGIFLYNDTDYAYVSDNVVYLTDSATGHEYGMSVGASEDHNIIKDNNLQQSGKNTNLADSGTDTIIRNNIGYTTENSGSSSVANNSAIAHNCDDTPTNIILTSTNASNIAAATAVNSTHITVGMQDYAGNVVTTPETVYWYAEVR